MTLKFIQSQLKEKILKVRKGKTKNKGNVVYEIIKLYEFSLALQSLLYDCIPSLSSFYGKKVDSTIPKMNKWKAIIENPSFDELSRIIFDSKVICIILLIYVNHLYVDYMHLYIGNNSCYHIYFFIIYYLLDL